MNNVYFKLKFLTFLDHEESEVSSGKRIAAYLIDWFLGALMTLLPLCLMWAMATGDTANMNQVSVFTLNTILGKPQALLAGLAGLLLCLWYYVYVPWKVTPGQTPGKRTMNIAIARKDGQQLTLKDLLIRQVVGLLLLEGMLLTGSTLLRDVISLASGLNFTGILSMSGMIITIVSVLMALLVPSRRMLHDYLAKTHLVPVESDREDQQI